MSLLEQDTIKKGRVNKLNKLLKPEKEIETGNSKEYEVQSIVASVVYSKEANN